tara:strand:- start:4487 stop:5584 length:1098 start_codon:yes stop_codon:yes gene_type:complete
MPFIGKQSTSNSQITNYTTTVGSGGQTNFTVVIEGGDETHVYLNGVLLKETTDYTVSSTQVSLVSPAVENDIVEIKVFRSFALADAVRASDGGTFSGDVTVPNLIIGDGGNIGSASDTDAISIASDGGLTFSGGIDNAGTISAGTIGSGVTITDGASPHGWQHIGTKHYNTDTSPTDTSYFPLVNEAGSTLTVSSEFSAYKILFQLSNSSGVNNLMFRFMTGASTYETGSHYTYYIDYKQQNGDTGHFAQSGTSHDSKIFISEDNYTNAGGRGNQGEITIFNAYASASDVPTIDGNAYPVSRNNYGTPHGYFNQVGHNSGTGDQYIFGGFKYNNNIYVTGFAFYFESNASMYQGSWTSIYGLKLA